MIIFQIKLNVINTVIPAAFGPIKAHAGIHKSKYWIPAFAGMTSVFGAQAIKLVYLK